MTPATRPEIDSPRLIALNGGAVLPILSGVVRRQAIAVRLGDLLVAEGLATPAEIQKALRIQSESKKYMLLGEILVAQKVITRSQLLSVLDRHRRRSRLGELLVKSKAITPEQLETALSEQRRWKQTIGEVVVRLRYVTEEQMRRALCQQLHINFFDLDTIVLDLSLRALINPRFAKKRLVVPIARVGQTLVVAMDDPTRTSVIDDLKASTGLDIEVITSTTESIRRALAQMYPTLVGSNEPAPAPVAIRHQLPGIVGEPNILSFEEIDRLSEEKVAYLDVHHVSEGTASIVRRLLGMAVEWGASDIHLEAVDHGIQTRFRVDGVLQELDLGDLDELMNQNRGKLMSRLKILSKLDIAERRRPQDGSFRARLARDGQTTTVDFRISIIPGYYGESAVIRILDPRGLPQSVEALGLRTPVTLKLRQLLRSSTGMILVTGPTGSGKSTTLFGALKSVYQPGIKVLTAENPIEYVCDNFRQHEVDERLGNTFAKFLRSFLRHDPDVIMVGEIRDSETANLAFRAAQTGHLVLSTLHTNDAISALPRLLDLGVDANLIASSLLGVLSQRLAREVCGECRNPMRRPASSSRRRSAPGTATSSGTAGPDASPATTRAIGALDPVGAVDPERRRRGADQQGGALRRGSGERAAHDPVDGRRRHREAIAGPDEPRGADSRAASLRAEAAPARVGLGACRPRSAARRQRATNLVDDRGVARA
jgi:type IV pilus assembly protein PilB